MKSIQNSFRMNLKRKTVILFVILTMINCSISEAASGSAKVFHFTTLNSHGGTSSNVRLSLSNMGYSATKTTDASTTVVKQSFGSCKVVHIQSHGSAGRLLLTGAPLSANDITSYYSVLDTKFVFLLACYSANSSNTYGDLDNTLFSLGTESTLAFSGSVYAAGSTDGIYYFSKYLYQNVSQNLWNISTAATVARNDLYLSSNKYYGTDTMVIKGGSTRIY